MKLPSPFVITMTIVLTMMVGSAFIVIDVLMYLYIVFAAMGLMALAVLSRLKQFSLPSALLAAFILAGPIILSAVANGGAVTDIIPPLALALLGFLAVGFGANSSGRELEQIMASAAICSILCLVAATVANGWDILGAVASGRRLIIPGMHPNLFALIALTIFMLVASSRNLVLVGVVFVIAFVVCLAASSRSALLTMIVVLAASRFLLLRRSAGSVAVVAFAFFALTAALLLNGSFFSGLADSVFHVNDQYRGAATGGSGRTVLWAHYIENWKQNPLLGTGPGTVYELAGRSYYSHNIVLQLLTDAGLIGLVAFVGFLAWSISAARSPAIDPFTSRMVYLLVLSYLVYGLFEGRAVNVGNPLSALFFMMTIAVIGCAATSTSRYAPPVKSLMRGSA